VQVHRIFGSRFHLVYHQTEPSATTNSPQYGGSFFGSSTN
jgi:hypothetical protein